MFIENISLAEFREKTKTWKSNLTNEEKDIILKYSDLDYCDINEALLEQSKNGIEIGKEIQYKINILDKALIKCTFDTNIKVQRVENVNKNSIFNIMKAIEKTKTFYYPNYISTSIDSSYSKTHQFNWDKNIIQIVIEAIIPKGTKCAFLDEELSYFPEEKEVLILRDCVLIILNIEDKIEEENKVYLKGIFKQLFIFGGEK